MGHRANYVIVKNGQPHIHYSHWGGLTVLEDVFFGPEPLMAFVATLPTTDELLDDIWCEGAVAADFDARRVLVFGGEALFSRPAIRRVYLALARLNWPGWDVRWAPSEQVSIAEMLGMSAGLVRSDLDADFEVPPTAKQIRADRAKVGRTLITVRDGRDRLRDFRFDLGAANLLAVGSALLEWLEARPIVPFPTDAHAADGRTTEGALIDEPA